MTATKPRLIDLLLLLACPFLIIDIGLQWLDWFERPRCGQCKSDDITVYVVGLAVLREFGKCNACGWQSEAR